MKNKKHFLRGFVQFASGLILLSSCTGAHALEPDALFEKLSPSVWGVLTVDAKGQPLSRGSAVVIGAGRLVTNCHVLAKASSFVVRRENVAYGATLEYPDVERDLCQIKVANFTAPAVEMADVARLKVGSKVYAIGNPRGLEVTFSDGLVSGLRRGEGGVLEVIQTSAPVSSGSSGGGLFDTDGRLVGITSFILRDSQNLNFALPVTQVSELEVRGKAALANRQNDREKAATFTANGEGLRSGDAFEYTITDAMTRRGQKVVLRVGKLNGDRIEYETPGRVERTNGEMVSIERPELGEFDVVTPPGGWFVDGEPLASRSLKFTSSIAGYTAQYRLDASRGAEMDLTVPAGTFRVVPIHLEGWMERIGGMATGMTGRYRATLWLSTELHRVVRFVVDSVGNAAGRGDSFIVRETLELTSAAGR